MPSHQSQKKHPLPKTRMAIPALAGVLTFLLALAGSVVGGRALWTDEILRILGQRLSVADLLAYEHLKTFCTQTPSAYLFMRPWQSLCGMETGGALLPALAGAVTVCAILFALRQVLGRSGYRLCNNSDLTALQSLPLPASHHRMGPMMLRDALLTLAGPGWDLSVDDNRRQVCFSRIAPLVTTPVNLSQAVEAGVVRPSPAVVRKPLP